jgi:hypothetical protein
MDAVKGILKFGFFPRYCPEYSLDKEDIRRVAAHRPPMAAAPMVCFCDLPLSLIGKHLKEYGSFGIGLEKTWGIQNGVAPVLYTHSKAKTRPPVSRLTTKEWKGSNAALSRDRNFLAAYTKPFEGHAWKDNRTQKKKVRFYDEKEWRYVPVIRGSDPLFLNFKDYKGVSKRNAFHKVLKKRHSLKVTPDDIQYLIVPYDKNEKNILRLHDYIMRLYGRRYGHKDAVLVGTTIMTDDCIKEDI